MAGNQANARVWLSGDVYVGPVGTTGPTDVVSPLVVNEVQTVTISGGPTGGSFTLAFSGQVTAAIAFNATAAAVQAALEALGNIDPGDVTVTGVAGGPYTVTFAGNYLATDVPQLVATSALTGGTAPAVTVATTVAGGTGFRPVGLLATEGLTRGRDQDKQEHYAWGGRLIRSTRSKFKRSFTFRCLETNAVVNGLLDPGSTVISTGTAGNRVTTRTVKAPTVDPRAWVFQIEDGPTITRIHVPKGEVSEVGEVGAQEEEVTVYEMTVDVYGASDGTFYTEISNDQAIAV